MSAAISKFPTTRSLYPAPGSGKPVLAAPDVTLTIRRSQRSLRASDEVTNTSESALQKSSDQTLEKKAHNESESEQKETIYESLNNFNTEFSAVKEAKSGLKEDVVVNNERDDLYAKVKKLSSSNTSDKSNCSNLNSDFVSIYELTKVETLNNSKSDEREENTNNNVYKASPALVRPQDTNTGQRTLSPKTLMREKSDPDFNFALDFSPKREINKVSFASFQPDTDEDNVVDDCDNIDNAYHYPTDDEEEDEVNFRSKESLINSNRSSYNMHSSNIDNSQVQNDSIPKVQLNMFIQKDAKQSGGKKWPKVETPFCRENRINEVYF